MILRCSQDSTIMLYVKECYVQDNVNECTLFVNKAITPWLLEKYQQVNFQLPKWFCFFCIWFTKNLYTIYLWKFIHCPLSILILHIQLYFWSNFHRKNYSIMKKLLQLKTKKKKEKRKWMTVDIGQECTTFKK